MEDIVDLSRMSSVIGILYGPAFLGNSPMNTIMQDEDILKRIGVIKCYLDDCVDVIKHKELRRPKNDQVAQQQKNLGNEYFKRNMLDTALIKYNTAICYATKDSENLAISYANRSAVYFNLELYEECLKNIELAKEHNYPARLMPKLLERERNAKNSPPKDETVVKPKEIKVSEPVLPKIPFMKQCAHLRRNEFDDQGFKDVYATKFINTHEVILMEEAPVFSIKCEEIYKRCNYCLNDCDKSLIPCETCTKAMFCSEECKAKAWEEFHQYDCEIIDALLTYKRQELFILTKIVWLAIQGFKVARCGLKNWMMYYLSTDYYRIQNLKTDYTQVTRKQMYRAMLGLTTDRQLSEDKMHDALTLAYVAYRLVTQVEPLKSKMEEKMETILFQTIVHHSFSRATHHFPIFDVKDSEENEKLVVDSIGQAMYPIGNLFNHSSSKKMPNVLQTTKGKCLITFASRPIKKGEQLLSSFGLFQVP